MAQPTFTGAVAVTPSDSTKISKTAGLYVGGAGDVTVQMGGEGALAAGVTFKAVPVGTTLNIMVVKVFATGTTATNILALR